MSDLLAELKECWENLREERRSGHDIKRLKPSTCGCHRSSVVIVVTVRSTDSNGRKAEAPLTFSMRRQPQ
jgi:hypothetical protein